MVSLIYLMLRPKYIRLTPLVPLHSLLRHLINFVLLFASNVENFIFYMLHDWVNASVLYFSEIALAILYLYFVIKTFLWFIEPLSKREEWEILLDTIEDSLGALANLFRFKKQDTPVRGSLSKPAKSRKSILKMKTDVNRLMGKDTTE